MRLVIPALIALSAAGLAAQQPVPNTNEERMANDHYTRSHDYDLVHQRIQVRDFNWDSTSFHGTVTTTIIALRPSMDSVIMDAGSLLAVKSVTSATGAALPYSRHGDTIVVHFGKPVAFHDSTHFTIDYDARITNGRGLTYITARSTSPDQIWSQGEDTDNHFWFPTYDFPNDKMTWEVEATVPQAMMAVSNGSLVSDTKNANATHTLHWSQSTPSATYLVSLIVAPLAKVHDMWGTVPVDAYVYRQDSALAKPLFHITVDMIETYSKLTGVQYPWAKYAQTTVADFFGGMENVSATTLVDWLPDARAYRDRPWYQYILIPHELAHQWFGDYVTTENWANTWLNEGFAEFMPGQYWGTKQGSQAEQDYYVDEYEQYIGTDDRRVMPLASMGSNNIYPKGALVLEMLKTYLGPDRFWAGIHRYLSTHAYAGATSDDLRQAFLDATGENLDWFWSEWVYGAGFPKLEVKQSYDAAAHRLTVIVTQTQQDTLKADSLGVRYVVPAAFRMPYTIRVGTASGDVVKHAWLSHRVDTVYVDAVNSAPTMFVFDDGNAMVKSLSIDEPVEWQARQLAADSDLWNRRWIIENLAEQRGNATAQSALEAALTSSDATLTRSEAAEALAGSMDANAEATLERAMHDTSSRVRTSAAQALSARREPSALAVLRTAWTTDSSYNVRAAALGGLIRRDTANRKALIAEALSTHSYRDEYLNTAMSAVVGLRDTSFIPRIQALAGDFQLSTAVLGVFAAGGDLRAKGALVGDLDDSRQWVRQWAVAAIASRFPTGPAITVFQEALPGIKHPDSRLLVSKTITMLQARPH